MERKYMKTIVEGIYIKIFSAQNFQNWCKVCEYYASNDSDSPKLRVVPSVVQKLLNTGIARFTL